MATMPLVPLSPPPVNGIAAPPLSSTVPDVQGQLMHVSPQMAADLLKRRLPNRPISKARVRVMIEDMRAGHWVFNGEPLILTEALDIADGQHRLQAIYESGVTLPLMVVVGVQPDTAVVMSIDQGRAKTGADMLSMHELSSAQTLAATCRWLYRYERGAMRTQTTTLRDAELPAYVAARPSLPVSLPWGRRLRALLPQSCAAALFHVFHQQDAALAQWYFTDLAAGTNLEAGHPAHRVRDRLLIDRSPRNHAGVVARAALLALGWNVWRAGEPYGTGFAWKGEKDATIPFPQIV